MEQLSTANTRFAVDLFRTLNENNPTGNIFISPLSISSALAMIFLGTKGTTAAQVSKVSRNKNSLVTQQVCTEKLCLWALTVCFKNCISVFNNHTLWGQTFRKAPKHGDGEGFHSPSSFYWVQTTCQVLCFFLFVCFAEDTAVKKAAKALAVCCFFSIPVGRSLTIFPRALGFYSFCFACDLLLINNACYVLLLLSIMTHRKCTNHSGEVGGIAFLREQAIMWFCIPEA